MARCRECRAHNVRISATSSRKSFAFKCVNPRCRASYVQTLGIARDLGEVFSSMQSRRIAVRRVAGAVRYNKNADDTD